MSSERACPECGEKADKQGRLFEGPSGPMFLGLHRRREHGVAGTSKPSPGSGPPRGARGRPRKDRAPAAKPRAPSLKADLRRVFKIVGAVVGVADPYCGGVLVDHSGAFCDALARLAAEDPRIARWLAALGKAGPYGALALAAGELAIPIAAHHGLVAPEATILVGVTPPSVRRLPMVPVEPDGSGPEDARSAGHV